MRSRRALLALGLAGVAACFFPDPSPFSGDAGSDGGLDAPSVDAPADVAQDGAPDVAPPPMCDPSKPFSSVAVIAELEIDDEYKATLTPDELEIWFGETLHSDAGNTSEVFHARRGSLTSPFGTAAVEPSIAPGDVDPAVTADGLTLYYSKFGTVGNWDLFMTTRPDRTATFGLGVQLPGAIQSTADDVAAFVAFDGALWFSSGRAGSDDIWRAAPQGTSFASPTLVTSLSSPANEQGAILTNDGLWAYVSSDRTDLGTEGSFDIFLAHRASTSDDFGPLVDQTELSGSSAERPNWISRDDCRLYFESTRNRPGGSSLYIATKFP